MPPRQGLAWIRQGFRVFARAPFAFAGLFATFVFALFALALVPLIGTFLAVSLLPLVTVGFMIATRRVLEGAWPTPRVYLEPLQGPRPRRVALIQLGVAYAVATVAIVALGSLVDGGAFNSAMESLQGGKVSPEAASETMAADPRIEFGLLVRFGLAAVLAIPFWHAPALVHWDGHGWAKALFSSTVAIGRNLGAFTLYFAGWFGVILLAGIAANLIFALFGAPQLMAVALVPLSLMLSTIFYASLYFTFADSFVADDVRDIQPQPEEQT